MCRFTAVCRCYLIGLCRGLYCDSSRSAIAHQLSLSPARRVHVRRTLVRSFLWPSPGRPSNFLRSSAMRTTLWNNCAGRYFRLLFSPAAAVLLFLCSRGRYNKG
ncbi:hypothetical protein PUN28_011653 [Cardiocondyla obscurior]|uniref:Secreted protein n=1 Tax=Cardiocondyla obscurior TaxID=286306 RepID=A0AAW2FEY4_9HYME